jgi:hypothetical protein
MRNQRWYGLAAVLAIVASACALTVARAQKPDTRAEFMRQKLEYSTKLLEGLTRGDFPQIAGNAKSLRALSAAADWAEPNLRPETRYGWFSLEFQELTDEIAARAAEKNIDGATLGYLQLTANCVRCHRHVRDAKK